MDISIHMDLAYGFVVSTYIHQALDSFKCKEMDFVIAGGVTFDWDAKSRKVIMHMP